MTIINQRLTNVLHTLLILMLTLSGCAHLETSSRTVSLPAETQSQDLPEAAHAAKLSKDTHQTTQTAASSQSRVGDESAVALKSAESAAIPQQITDWKQPSLPDQAETNQELDEDSPVNSSKASSQQLLDEALELCQVSQSHWQKGELEKAIESLDQAYALILNVQTNDPPKLTRQKEDLRFMISKRILEIYASRHIVVNGHHEAIPIVLNKHVMAEIRSFTEGPEKNFFLRSYKRSGRFRDYIVTKLREAGLPEELSWLPLIESGYKVNALSRARALGLWQFISSTGYKFGLKRDTYIDERIDPIKATHAAIAYLKELHQIFGDWTTVLAAYNCGEGRVLRVIRSQNVNYLDNFWDLYERLPVETARYVPRFLATLHIVKNPERYGLTNVAVEAPMEFEVMTVSKRVHLKDISKKLGEPLASLVALNPELRHKILPEEAYPLRVPPGKTDLLVAGLDEIPVYSPPRRAFVYHRIRPGETLSTIAKRYRTSVSKIVRANNIRRSHFIVAGKRLKIPLRGATIPQSQKQVRSSRRSIPAIHLVKRGDSLYNIAKRYGTTTQKIQTLNRLTSTTLHIGQPLKIPGGVSSQSQNQKTFKTYLVQSQDSPYGIAQKHNMDLNRFLKINNLSKRSTIYPGQKLYVE